MATPIPDNQASFTLHELAEACGGQLQGDPGLQLRGVTTDSRRVGPGKLFVALKGERWDAHDFLGAVRDAGAGAAVIERSAVERSVSGTPTIPEDLAYLIVDDSLRALGDLAAWHRRRWHGQVIGITGSVGKTSAKELIASGLAAAGRRVLRTHGNLNNLVGLPMMVLLLDDQVDTAVLEMGMSAPGEIARLAEIAGPDVGVVTAVSLAHAHNLTSVEAIAEEKSALLRALKPDGLAIYSADAPSLQPWLAKSAAKRRISFGSAPSADVRVVDETPTRDLRWGCRFEVRGRSEQHALRLLGKGGAHNAAGALAVAEGVLDTPAAKAAFGRGIEQLAPVPGRMVAHPTLQGFLIIDDTYNASPTACVAALEAAVAIAGLRGGTLTAVLGDMAELGAHTEIEHQKLGRKAVQLGVATLVTCGRAMAAACDAAIVEVSQSTSRYATRVMHLSDPLEAAELAARGLVAADVVLVKGSRSMAMERVVEALLTSGGRASGERGAGERTP